MCGIIYYKTFCSGETVNRYVLRHYLKQKQRGAEGFGFVGISKKNLFICRATSEHRIKSYLKKTPASEIMFHHRMPTSTANTVQTTHPILVSQPIYQHNYYLIHNGIIYNASELKAEHEKLGIKYVTLQRRKSQNQSIWGWGNWREQGDWKNFENKNDIDNDYEFNDSEALAHEIALFLEGKKDKVKVKGDVAFICLETDRNNNALKLHFARNRGSPLEMKKDVHMLIVASEHVSDAETDAEIPTNKLHTFDYRTQKITLREINLPFYESFTRFSLLPFNTYLDELEAIEMIEKKIQEYEEKINRIESAQRKASIDGDLKRYERLEHLKKLFEERLEELYNYYYYYYS